MAKCGEKRIKTVRKATKIGCVMAIIAVNILLCGCYAQREPQNRNYIMCMGIDVTEKGWQIAYSFPDLALLTGTDANSSEPVQVIEAASLREGAGLLNAASDKIADYSQLSVILLGENVSGESLERLLGELAEEKGIKRTVMIGRTVGSADAIVRLDEKVNGSIGVFLYELGQNNYENRGYKLSVLEDFIGGRSARGCVTPVFENREDRPVLVEFSDILRYTRPVEAQISGKAGIIS